MLLSLGIDFGIKCLEALFDDGQLLLHVAQRHLMRRFVGLLRTPLNLRDGKDSAGC
jgi:hypothetical protein